MPPAPLPYRPRRAWGVAALYLALLLLLSLLGGTPQALATQPSVAAAQLRDPLWWLLLLASAGLTIHVYGGYWAAHTLRFGRRLRPVPQAGFGMAWGLALGLWMLTLLRWSHALLGPGPLAVLLGFCLISCWQVLAQSYVWGVYVTPEHDTPLSNRCKVVRCHVPHLLMSCLFLGVTGSGALFVGLQMLALGITSVAMRMPVWWERLPQQPPTSRPGWFGLPRTHGFEVR